MIGHLVSCYGAADRYLGMLAATLGERERAEHHFEQALALNRRMGAATWLAHTGYEYARFLLGRSDDDRRSGGGASRARPRLWRSGSECPRCSLGSGRSALLGAAGRASGRPFPPRSADPRSRRPGPEQPGDRRDALDQRAHGRQPHPQHPAQDGLRQPHRGRVLRPPARARLGPERPARRLSLTMIWRCPST